MGEEVFNLSAVATDPSVRQGSYSNLVVVTSQQSEEILDFFFVDSRDEDGAMSGVVVSRVIMSRDRLVALRDALNDHLSKVPGSGQGN